MLVDADSIFFKIAYRPKSKFNLRQEFDKFCKEMELEVRNKLHNDFGEGNFIIKYAVKGKGNFRKDLYSEYKANRPNIDEEIRERLNYLYKHAISKWNAVPADGMEADDLVSIWAYEARDMEAQYIICGIDKDLKQIPGNHYNYGKGTWEFINDKQAYRLLMTQALTGDNSDNIPGLKGIGPKKAEKLLEGKVGLWNEVKKAWTDSGHSVWEAKRTLQLLTMLKSWKEFEDVKAQISSKASISKPDDISKQVDKE